MSGYYRLIFMKKFRHLTLCKPHRFVLHLHQKIRTAIFGSVYDD